MSTLKVTEIQSLSASTPPLFEDSSGAEMGRLCRAFVNFDGTGTVFTNQTIRASFNVSSVFKNETGYYTINFTNAMPDANYSVSSCASNITGVGNACPNTLFPMSSTNVSIILTSPNLGTVNDSQIVTVDIFR